MNKEKEESPVLKFVKLAWDYCAGIPFSWERFNQDVRSVCHLAAAGFPWESHDLDDVFKLGNWESDVSRCLGEDGVEGLYTIAVEAGNKSAWIEIERYLSREPIIADNVAVRGCRTRIRKRGRLCVRAEFMWKGERVRVTSFNKDGHAVCCSYKIPREYPEKIARRFIVSPDDVKQERREMKKRRVEAVHMREG